MGGLKGALYCPWFSFPGGRQGASEGSWKPIITRVGQSENLKNYIYQNKGTQHSDNPYRTMYFIFSNKHPNYII